MWWKVALLVLVLTGVCFVLGLYAGGNVFLQLIGVAEEVTWHTLMDASNLGLNDPGLVYLPWAWCVTLAITFLPLGITLLAFFLRFKPVTSLHGNARFANDAELRAFEYKGEYQ